MALFLMRTRLVALSVFTVAAITAWVVFCAIGAIFGGNEWGLTFTWIVSLILGALLLPSIALGFAAVIFLTPSVVSRSRRPLYFVSAALGCVLPLGAVGAGWVGDALTYKGGLTFMVGFVLLSPLLGFGALRMCRSLGLLAPGPTGCCPVCGYDLTGTSGLACPECGGEAI